MLKWNEPSIKFYESEAVGATMMHEWAGMRVDGDKLEKLAGDTIADANGVREENAGSQITSAT